MTEPDSSSSQRPVRRGRRREARQSEASTKSLQQLPWGQPRYLDPPFEPVGAEGVQRIHEAAMRILEEIGIDFLHEGARDILAAAGCEVKSGSVTVRMDRAMVMEPVSYTHLRAHET